MAQQYACPQCGSLEVVRLPKDQISPLPGYVCRKCGLLMRASGSAILYSVVLVISLGISAFTTMPFWAEGVDSDRWLIGLTIAGVVVAAYSVRQLLRPKPLIAVDPETGEPL